MRAIGLAALEKLAGQENGSKGGHGAPCLISAISYPLAAGMNSEDPTYFTINPLDRRLSALLVFCSA